jgi:uncharacterized protein (DUF1015 family)
VASLHPLRGIRYDPEQVRLAGVLAPPYDVISPQLQEELYAHDRHNIVRVDYGEQMPGDVNGVEDRYTRAAAQLRSWLDSGILRRNPRPSLYVHEHGFVTEDGRRLQRTGVFARAAALPWEQSEVRPHERTMRGPKEDRLALMRATRTQTSAVFVLWDRAQGIAEALAAITAAQPQMSGHHAGEVADEVHRLWVVDDAAARDAVLDALRPATVYVADGHHRFETAAAYAQERRTAEPDGPDDADFAMTLLYLCAAADPAIEVLPTHRLVRPADGVPRTVAELAARLDSRFVVVPQGSLSAAAGGAAALRATRHAFAVAALDGAALVHAPRTEGPSPRSRLDVVVLQDAVLGDACGLDTEQISAGALAYTRSIDEAQAAVTSGIAALALCVNGCTTEEIIAVSDAGETMPQKSTYFYPKVPTGLVLSPL